MAGVNRLHDQSAIEGGATLFLRDRWQVEAQKEQREPERGFCSMLWLALEALHAGEVHRPREGRAAPVEEDQLPQQPSLPSAPSSA
ncbi:MAG: hypothetical protein WA633_03830 [Stellaceae bacterium]